jgi:hypothetical protein
MGEVRPVTNSGHIVGVKSIGKQPLLTIHSLAQLQAAEEEIVSLAEAPVISQLFLLDPVRALADTGVSLSPEAVREWEAVAPAAEHT